MNKWLGLAFARSIWLIGMTACSNGEQAIEERTIRVDSAAQVEQADMIQPAIQTRLKDSASSGYSLLAIAPKSDAKRGILMQEVDLNLRFKEKLLPQVIVGAKVEGDASYFEYALCSTENPDFCLPGKDQPGVFTLGEGLSYLAPVGEVFAQVRACSGVRFHKESNDCSDWLSSRTTIEMPNVFAIDGYLEKVEALQRLQFDRHKTCEVSYLRVLSYMSKHPDLLSDSNLVVMLHNALQFPSGTCVSAFEVGLDEELLVSMGSDEKALSDLEPLSLTFLPGLAQLSLMSGAVFNPQAMVAAYEDENRGLNLSLRVRGFFTGISGEASNASKLRHLKGASKVDEFDLPDTFKGLDEGSLRAYKGKLEWADAQLLEQNRLVKKRLDDIAKDKNGSLGEFISKKGIKNGEELQKAVDDFDAGIAQAQKKLDGVEGELKEVSEKIKQNEADLKNAKAEGQENLDATIKEHDELVKRQKNLNLERADLKKKLSDLDLDKRQLTQNQELTDLLEGLKDNNAMLKEVDKARRQAWNEIAEKKGAEYFPWDEEIEVDGLYSYFRKYGGDENAATQHSDVAGPKWVGVQPSKRSKVNAASSGLSPANALGDAAQGAPKNNNSSLTKVALIGGVVLAIAAVILYVINKSEPDAGQLSAENESIVKTNEDQDQALLLTENANAKHPFETFLQGLKADFELNQRISRAIFELEIELLELIADELEASIFIAEKNPASQ